MKIKPFRGLRHKRTAARIKSLKRDRRGAVTIIVSLMLIPAILLSGTAVDLARIHTAKSMAQNASQLVTNAALTQYTALLKDLYGLFGVAKNDRILADMVNEYIAVTVFGEKEDDSWIKSELGTFQIFHGSKASGSITPVDGFHLDNGDVLRRQIEEYMKFRGPVILVERLLEALSIEGGGSLKDSNAALEKQKVVDGKLRAMLELFNSMKALIDKADQCPTPGADPNVAGGVGVVGGTLGDIRNVFVTLGNLHTGWKEVCARIDELKGVGGVQGLIDKETDPLKKEQLQNELEMLEGYPEDPEDVSPRRPYNMGKKKDYERIYAEELKHIEALAKGNGTGWTDIRAGEEEDLKDMDGTPLEFSDGTPKKTWKTYTGGARSVAVGLENSIANAKTTAESFKQNFANVQTKAAEIQSKRAELEQALDELDADINRADSNCEPDLKAELQQLINECRKMLEYFEGIDFGHMAEPYKVNGDDYIEKVKERLDRVRYPNPDTTGDGSLSREQLAGISGNAAFVLNTGNPAAANRSAAFGAMTANCGMPDGFLKFTEGGDSYVDARRDFYAKLEEMAARAGEYSPKPIADGIENTASADASPEEKQRNVIDQLLQLAETAKTGLSNDPRGAHWITDSSVPDGDVGGIDTSKVIDFITDPATGVANLADWALLMTYDVSMFSNYTTGKPASFAGGEKPDPAVSVTDVPIDQRVNYFYQSEWEYLFAGKKSAEANLNAVRELILNIRRICNAIVVFKISDIKSIAEAIKNACSAIPYVGVALGWVLYFATFAAFTEAESTVDLMLLRDGHKVPLIKNTSNDEWQCRPSNVVSLLETLEDSAGNEQKSEHENEEGVSYEQYMLLFLLLSSGTDTLAERTGNLIEWNVINYQKQACAGNTGDNGHVSTEGAAGAMSAAFAEANCFRLKDEFTDFNATTNIDLRLMFLTMPLFTRQGSPFTGTYPITATHYGGY